MSIRDELTALIARIGDTHVDADNTDFHEDVVDAILAHYGVVELPTLNDPDDDGQIYTDVAELRIDTSGPNGNEVFLPGGSQTSPHQLRQEASDYLAAANRAEAQS
ncbi:hypothetical protein [Rhodococcus rhodochrous]|uniref:hypothetical protein n=1 Tax=Rhodococcus rhodochrous TaxID=1829 RepID=UPI0002F6AB69|nr:hypothetical protein [Rhodococcus rhodochrous]